MSLTDTPNANRLHIALFGRRNSGKSSLINALTGQDTALVSDTPGTTTDPVAKAMEIHGIGPCLFIDTPGFDDEGELGRMRIERTWKAVEKTDMAILFCGGDTSAGLSKETKEPDFTEELYWLEQLKAKGIPTILLINKTDIRKDSRWLSKSEKVSELLLSESVQKRKQGSNRSAGLYWKNSLRISASKVSPER